MDAETKRLIALAAAKLVEDLYHQGVPYAKALMIARGAAEEAEALIRVRRKNWPE